MSTETEHTPVPDGKTGPWLRGPRHAVDGAGRIVYDPRCHACRSGGAWLAPEVYEVDPWGDEFDPYDTREW